MSRSIQLVNEINGLLESEKLTSAAESVFGAGKIPEKLMGNKSLNFQGHKTVRNEYQDEAVKAHNFLKKHASHMGSYDQKGAYGPEHIDHYNDGIHSFLVHHDRDTNYTHRVVANPMAIRDLKDNMSVHRRAEK